MAKETITSDDILGKDAIDPEGEILGVVMKLHIDKNTKKLVGITIDEGFMKPDLFIGMSYVKNFGVDAVFVNRVPATKFRNLNVMTHEGNVIGTVKDVNAKRHKVDEMIIEKKGLTRKRFLVDSRDVHEIGENVVLKKGYKQRNLE